MSKQSNRWKNVGNSFADLARLRERSSTENGQQNPSNNSGAWDEFADRESQTVEASYRNAGEPERQNVPPKRTMSSLSGHAGADLTGSAKINADPAVRRNPVRHDSETHAADSSASDQAEVNHHDTDFKLGFVTPCIGHFSTFTDDAWKRPLEYSATEWRAKSRVELLKDKVASLERSDKRQQLKLVDAVENLSKEAAKQKESRAEIRKLRRDLKQAEQERDASDDELYKAEKKIAGSLRKIARLKTDLNASGNFPLPSPQILDWMVRDWQYESIVSDAVSLHGDGPIETRALKQFLSKLGIAGKKNAKDCPVLIVGRDEWDEVKLESLIDQWQGEELQIFSQEMFIATLFAGKNPFDDVDEAVLMQFAEGHPVLEYLIAAGFEWPFLFESLSELSSSIQFGSVDESPLRLMGYTVGKTYGVPRMARRQILHTAFTEDIPDVGNECYMEEWHKPKTRKRLWRIAHHIAWLINSRKTLRNLDVAVADWNEDLLWLKTRFYRPWMKFRWPETEWPVR